MSSTSAPALRSEATESPESAPSDRLKQIEQRIAPLRARLAAHPLYTSIRTAADLRIFMQAHVYAVWDFMSLLKALQARLTCVDVPWVPTPRPESRRFINEIVLGEESDVFHGRAVSHFELYLQAMREAGADVRAVERLLSQVRGGSVQDALSTLASGPRAFTSATFALIEEGQPHALAAAFTFGREDLIPAMFRALVRDLNRNSHGSFDTFIWYLERHIEVDGDDHGPLALRMVGDICGNDPALWEQATQAAETALQARLALWDSILAEIGSQT